MKEIIDFINQEICERRDYSASKAFEIVRDKIIEIETNKNLITKSKQLPKIKNKSGRNINVVDL